MKQEEIKTAGTHYNNDHSSSISAAHYNYGAPSIKEKKAIAIAVGSFELAIRSACGFRDDNLRPRLEDAFSVILRNDYQNPGPRSILVSKKRKSFRKLLLCEPAEPVMRFRGHSCTDRNFARTKAKLHLWEFRVTLAPNFRNSATHLKIFNIIGTISDIVYNQTSKQYELTDLALSGLSKATISDYIHISKEPFTVTMDATLPGEPKLTRTTSVVHAVGIALYKEIDGEYIPLEQGKMLEVARVF
jgi:hypothetical protein